MKNPALAGQLASFFIGDKNAELTFTRRLAAENQWTGRFAARVEREYLRFIYLACISEEAVTPSIAVDQAWHLHLCYTPSYWTDLCETLLKRPLHHGPTEGGRTEDAKFRKSYARTLTLYREEFGEEPPRDIWPGEKARFAPENSPISVQRSRHILIDRKRTGTVLKIFTAVAVLILLARAFCPEIDTPSLLVLLGMDALFAFMAWLALRMGVNPDGSGGAGCTASTCGTSAHHSDFSSGGHSGCGHSSGCGGGH
jgi:hypothetical protein